MFYKIKDRSKLLIVKDDFATLKSVNGEELKFEFCYAVSQRDAIIKKASNVIVTVFTKNVATPSIFKTSNIANFDTQSMIDAILTHTTDAQAASKAREEHVVFKTRSDISAKINNTIIGQIERGVASAAIRQTYKPSLKSINVEDLKASGDNHPVLQMYGKINVLDLETQASASLAEDVQKLAYNMILKDGIDPSSITSLTHRSISSTDSYLGTFRTTKSRETDESNQAKLLNYYIFNDNILSIAQTTSDVNDALTQRVLMNEPVDEVDVFVDVSFKDKTKKSTDFVQYFVKFEFVTQNNVAIDAVTRQLDVKQHITVFNTPKKAPIVKLVSTSNKRNLEIKQGDDVATGIQIFERTIKTSNFDAEPYVYKGSYSLKPNTLLNIEIDPQQKGVTIYRILSSNGDTLGFEFTNVVLRTKDYRVTTIVAINTQAVSTGIKVSARELPPNVISVQFMFRNRTSFDKSFTFLSTPIVIDATIKHNDLVSIVHTDVQSFNVYEYACVLNLDNGTQTTCTSEPIEHVPFSDSTVDTRITDVVISHNDSPNVQFKIGTETSDTPTDKLKTLLLEQGLYDLFQDTLKDDRELLKSLVTHAVHRVDLTTGQREDFGVVQMNQFATNQIGSASFDDNKLQKNSAVSKLQLGHKYRYEVFALLRAPETLFRSKKIATDPVTKKEYSYQPAKYFHPLTLRTGVLLAKLDSAARFVKSPFVHGNIGLTQTLNVSFDDDAASLSNAIAVKFDKKTIIISWSVSGNISIFDHFLVYKEVHGIRTFVGKVHNNLRNGVYFQHKIGTRDEGQMKYGIVPVFDDFKIGKTIETNQVIV